MVMQVHTVIPITYNENVGSEKKSGKTVNTLLQENSVLKNYASMCGRNAAGKSAMRMYVLRWLITGRSS